jgi:sugar lactone lactonase YvrE
VQTILFDENVAPQGSYLNDVRFSPDGRWGYITDSGAKGAIVVVDLPSGRARRALDGHPSTQPEKGVVVHADGKPVRRPDGRGVEFAADGIALSPDGKHLYWQAIKGRTLYRIATETLHDSALADDAVAAQVERVGENGPSDGLWIDRHGRMYISAIEEDAIKVRDGDRVGILVKDAQLRWPDTFSQHPDGSLYVTASRIQDMATFKPDSPAQLPTSLFRLRLPS